MSDDMKIKRRNVYISKRRTTIALEHYFWDMLDNISFSENKTIDEIITDIDNARDESTKLTATVRYIINQTVKMQHEGENASDGLGESPLQFPSAFHKAMENLGGASPQRVKK